MLPYKGNEDDQNKTAQAFLNTVAEQNAEYAK
jgi:hypothetical protein